MSQSRRNKPIRRFFLHNVLPPFGWRLYRALGRWRSALLVFANVPFAALGREGALSCDAAGTFTLALAFGELQLPAGGLSANGKVFAGAVSLAGGQSVSW